MRYDFKCEECDHQWEAELRFKEFKLAKDEGLGCPGCGAKAGKNVFSPGNLEVSMKGFQWAGKNYREKEYRKNRSRYMKQRQEVSHIKPTLAPNYNGERTATWKEARDAARDAGKFHETYDHLVAKEDLKK